MTYFKIKVDIYDWVIHYIKITTKNDYLKLSKLFKKLQVPNEDLQEIINIVKEDRKDGGEAFINTGGKFSIMILYKSTNLKDEFNIFCHEKRHIEDRILDYLGIDDIEAAAYLAGYIGSSIKFYNKK